MGPRLTKPEHELASAFLASASHDLRTPLNAVLGMLELSLDEQLSPTVREYLSTACESARTLTGNLNLLLELSEVEAQPLRVSEVPLDFRQIANAAIQALALATRNRTEVRIALPLDASLYGDDSRLERLIATLVEQAARWLEHSQIVLEVGGRPHSHDQFLLEIGVSEYGLGSPEEQARLAPLSTDEASHYASPGLALAAVRRWLDRVGGQLRTDLQTTGGRFYVRIPLSRTAPEPAAAIASAAKSETLKAVASRTFATVQQQQQQQQQHARPVRDSVPPAGLVGPLDVLVVDDTEANQKVVKAVLAKRGHRVELAGNGLQALDQLRRREFDVVLMDAQMPLMNGLEATAAIRRMPEERRSHVPIIAMTAHALQEDRVRCLAAGMDDYLAKPIDVATLVAHVEFYGRNPSGHHFHSQSHAQTRSSEASASPPSGPEPTLATMEPRPLPTQDFLAGARARLAGDEPLLLELIRLFRQDATSLLEKMAAGLRSKDSELSSRAAHNLRGLAANFDDARTVGAAGAVEKLALEGEFELAAAHLDTLGDECRRLIDALSDYEREQRSKNDF